MRPIHPLLAGTDKENLTFDRSDKPDRHPVNVRLGDKLMTDDEIDEFLATNNRTLPRRNWIPDNVRTGGFSFTIFHRSSTLFSVSTNQHEPELSKDKIEDLKQKVWWK
jgi:hypothetical protein